MLTTLIMAGTLAAAKNGITMRFVPSGAVERAGGYRPVQAQLSTTVGADVKKAPAGMANARYGEIKLAGKTFAFILDEAEGQAGKLYVDTNHDGDLTNDPATTWSVSDKNGMKLWQGTAKADIGKGQPVDVNLYHFDPSDARRAAYKNSLFYYGDYGYELTINLDGKSYKNFIAGEPSEKGRLWIDRDGNKKPSFFHEYATVGEPFNFTGTTYVVKLKDGKYDIQKADTSLPMAEMPPALEDGGKVLSFTAQTTDGKSVNFPQDFRGKIVMLDFWATWCGPCKAELPNVVKAYNANHDKGFEILGVSFDQKDNGDKLAQFTKDNNMSWRQIYEGKYWDTTIGKQFDVASIPFALLVDGDTGLIIATGDEMRGEGFSALVEKQLAKKGLKAGGK